MRTSPLRDFPGELRSAPEFSDGWMIDGILAPYISFVRSNDVNWSDELAELHEESSRDHFLDQWTREATIAALQPLSAEQRIVDLGCSTGYLLEDLAEAYPNTELFGVDAVAVGLVKAHETVPSAKLLQADVCDLPFSDGSFDAVVSANLLEHVADDEQALREMRRILCPGGRAVLVVPASSSTYDYYDRFLGHERRYDRHELADKAKRSGFTVASDRYLGSLIFPAFWTIKKYNRLRYGHLAGKALADRVGSDIARTQDSGVGRLLRRIEESLRLALPFGVRNLIALDR